MGQGRGRRTRLRAPLLVPAVAVSVGIVIDRLVAGPSSRLWAMLALVACGVAWWAPVRSRVPMLVMALIGLGAGWHHVCWFDLNADDLARLDWSEPTPSVLRGVLEEVPEYRAGGWLEIEGGSTRSVLSVRSRFDGETWHGASGRVLVYASGERRDLRMGQPVLAAGTLRAIEGPRNPGETDRRDYWRAQGIRLRLSCGARASLRPDPDGRGSAGGAALGWLRERSDRLLTRHLNPESAGLASALLLGRREAVDPEMNAAFARTGTSHLLAISGLHMQAVALLTGLFLLALGMSRRGSALVVMVAAVAYAGLVGASPSVVRSVSMTLVIGSAVLLDRPTRASNVLAMAWLVAMGLNPAYLFDVGCQLSFLAVSALVWGVPPVAKRLGLPAPGRIGFESTEEPDPESRPLGQRLDELERRYAPLWKRRYWKTRDRLLMALVASAVVWAWTLPLVVLRFHLVPWVGIVLNVVLVPLAMPTLASAGVTLMLSLMVPPLASVAARVCDGLVSLSAALVRWGAGWRWGHHYEPGAPGWWVLGFYVLLALWSVAVWGRSTRSRPASAMLAGWSVLGLGLALIRPPLPHPEAHVLAVDHGLAVVVRSPSGRTLLYDCGKMRDPGIGRRVVAPALWSMGVRRLDYVILSHADEDHYDGLPDLLERFSIGRVFAPAGFAGADNPRARALARQCREHGLNIEPLEAGSTLDLGPQITARVLHPSAGWLPDAPDNARSVVLELSSLGRRFLLTGDLEGAGLAELVMRPVGAYDALLAPHHGGKTANPDWFYDWARPLQVVASQRRPTGSDALEPIERQGRPVHRTWKDGAISLRWDSSHLNVDSFHKDYWLNPVDPSGSVVQAGLMPLNLLGAVPSGWVSSVVVVVSFVLGLVGCLVWGVMEWGAWALVTPGRRHDPDRPDREPAPWEPLTARGFDGVTLAGAWLGSEVAGGRTLALLHGFGEDRSALLSRAEAMSSRGWNVAVLDARGRGQSGGDRTSFGGRESHDLIAWVDVLLDRAGPGARLAAWGRSMGAASVLKAASEETRLCAIVLEAPYPDLTPAVASWLSRLGLPAFFARLLLHRARGLAGVSLHRPSPIELAPGVNVPVLLLVGALDPIAPPGKAHRLASAFPTPARVLEVDGAHHGDVFDLGGEPLADQVSAFLDESVGESA